MIEAVASVVSTAKEAAVSVCEKINGKELANVKECSEMGKNVMEPNLDIARGKSIDALVQMNLEKGYEQMPTRNQELEGKTHNDTKVPFVAKVVENSDGVLIKVVVPEFKSIIDVKLPDELLLSYDNEQFTECNKKLMEEVGNNSEIKAQFTEEQLEQIGEGETPDGFTWHHDAEKGKMQLIDAKIHAQTGHTGGKVIWGGGKENR